MTILTPTETELWRLTPLLDETHEAIAGSSAFARLREPVPPHVAPRGPVLELGYYVWEWLRHLGILGDLSIDGTIGASADFFKKLAGNIDDGFLSTVVATFTIADGQYATWTGGHSFFDTRSKKFVEEALPLKPVTLIVCNVMALYGRKQNRLRVLRGIKE